MKFASSENVDVKKNVIIFILISFFLFFVDRTNNKYLITVRQGINDAIIYTTVVVKSPFHFLIEASTSVTNFFNKDEFIDKDQISILENKVKELENEKITLNLQLDNLKKITGEENYKFETLQTKVLLYKSNILHQTIIINKGSNDNIKIGDPLIKNNILVGKILKTNFNSSHAILITNINSRVPVRIGKKNYNAILVGNPNSDRLLDLEFLPKEFIFEDGDYIYTNSIDGIMPDGLLVGQIKYDDNKKYYAKPLYDFTQLDYLTVVKLNKGKWSDL